MLTAEADDGQGGGFTWETRSAAFDQPIDPSLFQLTLPPGGVKVETLD